MLEINNEEGMLGVRSWEWECHDNWTWVVLGLRPCCGITTVVGVPNTSIGKPAVQGLKNAWHFCALQTVLSSHHPLRVT